MFDKECVPYAPALIESMRSIGYSFSAAIADLIDNSISAKANVIKIYSNPGSNPYLIIFDDGCGMTPKELFEAMRYGSQNPLVKRAVDDLGRFGLGLKAASMSQCRKLIVVSKKGRSTSALSWDLDYVIESNMWMLKGFKKQEIQELPQIDLLDTVKTGTYILLSEFDRIEEGTNDITETFNKCLNEMIDHLSLVFHRFIDDGLKIFVNDLGLEAKDPFLTYHKATQRKRESSFYINDEKIVLHPFILPHITKLNQKDLDKIGGKEKLRNEQGFYVYRNKRLIIWGTWFRLERKDELNKLARVMVDIPNSLDYMWSIDIKKSTASLPDIIKKNMYNAVYESVVSSEAVHTYRGRREKKNSEIEYIWERYKVREGYEYQINRNIPQIKLLEQTLDDTQLKLLDTILNTLEYSFPVSALYIDAAKGNIEERKDDEAFEAERLWDELQIQIEYVRKSNLSEREYYKAFMNVEPYCNNKVVIEKIRKEIEENE